MARTKRWEWSQVDCGYGEVKLHSWKYFTDFVHQEMLNYETYIWRGQRCDDWKLESTFDRLVREAKVTRTRRLDFRSKHLERFKYAVRGRRGNNPPILEAENDWWALGQHHGLATPLLDWTLSPFVAAYFAFIDNGEKQTRYRAIFALHRPAIQKKVKELTLFEEERRRVQPERNTKNALAQALRNSPIRPEVEFIRPLSDENQRLVNQGGLFTRSPYNIPLQDWVHKNYNQDDDGYILIKILVPNKDREECLRVLNRMNINHITLFPDLQGASKFCNLFSEVDKY